MDFIESPLANKIEIPSLKKDQYFIKFILLYILKPDLLYQSIDFYVEKVLAPELCENYIYEFNDLYVDSNNKNPILFILSPGADPMGSF